MPVRWRESWLTSRARNISLWPVQKMCNAVGDQHMEPRVQKNDLQRVARGGVLVAYVFGVSPQPHGVSLLFLRLFCIRFHYATFAAALQPPRLTNPRRVV